MKQLEQLNDAEYLGDNVWIGTDGWHVWLVVHDGKRTTDAVLVDPRVMGQVSSYLGRLGERRATSSEWWTRACLHQAGQMAPGDGHCMTTKGKSIE